jgi:SH3 domain-containing YSC84-like protein 1
MKFRSAFTATACAALVQILPGVASADTPSRLAAAVETLNSLSKAGDSEIPADLLKKASCVVVIPSLKSGAFIVGAEYGRGFASCRTSAGWSAPAAVKVEAGSVGFQIGGSESEVVLLVMNQKGMDRLLSSKFTLGGDATVAAGPVGRNAQAKTDATMRAEILSYSRSRGVFAGVSLEGGTLREDDSANKDLYGKATTNRAILAGGEPVPDNAKAFLSAIKTF